MTLKAIFFVSLDANNFCKLIPLATTKTLPFSRTSTLGKYFGYGTFILQMFVLGPMTLLTLDHYISKLLLKAICKSMQHLRRQLFILIVSPHIHQSYIFLIASQGLAIIS